ncbi:hypothetical protein H8959_011544 [Pygathrix nigripes]
MEGPSLGGPALGLPGLPTQQDCSIQEKIDLEIRMREGIWKLLSLSTQKDQVLHAVKNLMVCNARIMAYTSELQKLEEQIANQTGRCDVKFESKERTACKGKIAISETTLVKVNSDLMLPHLIVSFLDLLETRIRAMDKDAKKRTHNFSVINPVPGQAVTQIFAVDNREDLQQWMEAFWQHFFDLSQWKHCCEELMKIEIMSPRKPPLFLTKEATSVYHDISIDSPMKLESLTDIIQKKIEETNGQFLIGQHEESLPPPWATLFDGNHQMIIQKKVLSPASEPLHDEKGKKRRAPLPPPDKLPFSLKSQSNTDQLVKDNWGKTSISQTSSLDTKLSTLMHHLQKPMAAPRKLLPARKNRLSDGEHTDTKTNFEAKPVPAPREKSIKDILDPRSWLQAQV